LGERIANGVRLAQSEINDTLGSDAAVDVTFEDSELNPSAGVSAAQKLIQQDGVSVIIGPGASSVTLPVATSATIQNEILMVSQATTVELTDLDDNGYVVRTAPSDAFEGRALAKVISNEGVQDVGIIHLNDPYGEGLSETIQNSLENEHGGNVVSRVAFDPETFTPSSVLESAMSPGPDALVFIAFSENMVQLLRESFERGYNEEVQYFGPSSTRSDAIVGEIDERAVNGLIGTEPQPPVETNRWQNFKSSYVDEYESEPDSWVGYTYDAMNLAALAAQSAGSSDSSAIRDAIYEVSRPGGTEVTSFEEGLSAINAGDEINYEGVTGSLDMDDAGDVPGSYIRWVVEGGEYVDYDFVDV
jgi:branched-chain amino acid transport system substrate-binding protein